MAGCPLDQHAAGSLKQTAFFFFITLDRGPRRPLSLELSDTKVYEPQTRPHLAAMMGPCLRLIDLCITRGAVFKAHRPFYRCRFPSRSTRCKTSRTSGSARSSRSTTRPATASSTPSNSRSLDSYMTVVSDSHYQSTIDAAYVYAVPWSEFPIVPSYPHYPQSPPSIPSLLGTCT